MKEKLIVFILASLLALSIVGIGVATGSLGFKGERLRLPSEQKAMLQQAGIDSYAVSPLECQSGKCQPIEFTVNGAVYVTFTPKMYYWDCSADGCSFTAYTREQLIEQRDRFEANTLNELKNKALAEGIEKPSTPDVSIDGKEVSVG